MHPSVFHRAFSIKEGKPEVLLLDHPSHQQRLFTLLAKTYAMSFAANKLKIVYSQSTPADAKSTYVLTRGLKALHTWNCMWTAEECREACGGQGLKTENKVGHLKSNYDIHLTFEGDNNVLMQQVSKVLLADYFKRKLPLTSVGLEHMNRPQVIVPARLDSVTFWNPVFQLELLQMRARNLLERPADDGKQWVRRGLSLGNRSSQSCNCLQVCM